MRSSSGGSSTCTTVTMVVANEGEGKKPSLTRKVITRVMVEGFFMVFWYWRVRSTAAKFPRGADVPTRGSICTVYVVFVATVIILSVVPAVLPSMASAEPSLRVKEILIQANVELSTSERLNLEVLTRETGLTTLARGSGSVYTVE